MQHSLSSQSMVIVYCGTFTLSWSHHIGYKLNVLFQPFVDFSLSSYSPPPQKNPLLDDLFLWTCTRCAAYRVTMNDDGETVILQRLRKVFCSVIVQVPFHL